MYYVYVLYSERLARYYVGSTDNLEKRLLEHNSRKNKYTRVGTPWILVRHFECASRSEAMRLENTIKKRGIKRFLNNRVSNK
jgi:putative endonuclease